MRFFKKKNNTEDLTRKLIHSFHSMDFGEIKVRHIAWNNFELEAEFYKLISSDISVKKYLPGAYVETLEQAKEKIKEFGDQALYKAALPLVIANSKNQPIGYILCNAPGHIYKEIDEWTIDYWLYKDMRGKGIVTGCLGGVLNQFKDIGIPSVLFFVKKDNIKALKVLYNLEIKSKKESHDPTMYQLGVRLN